MPHIGKVSTMMGNEPEIGGLTRLRTSTSFIRPRGRRSWQPRQGKTPAHIAVAWILAHPEVTCAISGADTPVLVGEFLVGAILLVIAFDKRCLQTVLDVGLQCRQIMSV